MTIKQHNQKRGASAAPVLLAALAVAPLLFTTSCLSKRDRKTVEIAPAPLGEAANPDGPTAIDTTPTARPVGDIPSITTEAPTAPSAPPYSLENAAKYTVQPGDALSTIAASHGVSMADVKAANKIIDVNKIKAGDTILLPSKEALTPVETETETEVETETPAPEVETETEIETPVPPSIGLGTGEGISLPSE